MPKQAGVMRKDRRDEVHGGLDKRQRTLQKTVPTAAARRMLRSMAAKMGVHKIGTAAQEIVVGDTIDEVLGTMRTLTLNDAKAPLKAGALTRIARGRGYRVRDDDGDE